MVNKHSWQPDVYSCELRYYDRQQRLITKYQTHDGWSIATRRNKYLIDNPGDFYIHIEAQLLAFPTQAKRYSFIEVFYKDKFMQRQFVRDGELFPFMSDVENRRECPMIRKRLMTSKPVIRLSPWGYRRGTTIHDYLLKTLPNK